MNSNWTIAKIEEVAEVNPRLGKVYIPDDLSVSFVPMPAVGAGDGSIDVSQVRPFGEVKKGFTCFQQGDVLFAKITPCMENGKMAVVPKVKNGYGFGSTEFHVLRPKPGIDARYLYYYVSSSRFRGEAEHQMSGAVGQKRVPTQYLRECTIPLAPSNEQTRIVAEIEKQFSRLDEAVANLKRVKVNLKRYKAAVLKAAVEGKLVRNDGKWKQVTLRETCDVISGFAFKSTDFKDAGIPVIKIANISYGEFVWKDQEYLPTSFLENHKPCIVSSNDILLALTRPITNGLVKACRYPEKSPNALLNQRVAVIRPKQEILADFLLSLLQSETFKQQINGSLSETLQPNLSPVDLKKFQIYLPSLKEQEIIVAEVERRLSIVAGAEAQVDANLRRADRLRQSILKQAFSGQLVPQDSNDEPASVLLERIRNDVGAIHESPVSKSPSRARHKQNRTIHESPLRKPRQRTEPVGAIYELPPHGPEPAVSDDFASLDAVLTAILGLMQPGREYSRAELADALGLSTGRWNAAIQELKRRGQVRQGGEKRGARYALSRSNAQQ